MKWLNKIKDKAVCIKTAVIEDFTSNKKLTADQRERKRSRMVGRMTAGMMAVMMLTSMFGITAFADAGGGGTGRHRRRRRC